MENPRRRLPADRARISDLILMRAHARLPVAGLRVTGDDVPYGEARMLQQTMKKWRGSNTRPAPSSGPHQSLTSADPVKAWHTTSAARIPAMSRSGDGAFVPGAYHYRLDCKDRPMS